MELSWMSSMSLRSQVYYSVSIMDTPISIRVPADVLADIDHQAKQDQRSRHWVIIQRLRQSVMGSPVREYAPLLQRASELKHAANCRCYLCKPA
jgi:Ribbon-helix-helix protein, copG family